MTLPVWVCVRDIRYANGSKTWCRYATDGEGTHDPRCGEMRLVPVDALVLTRGEDGNWPEWIYHMPWLINDNGDITDLLDALAAKENPQW